MSGCAAADRNLLFGVLALQMDFLTRDQLVEGMLAWVLEKSQPLEELLVAKGFLAAADRDLLLPLVARHVARHGGDAEQSLKALSSVTPSVELLWQIEDADVQHSLASLHLRGPVPDSGVAATVSFRPNFTHSGSRYLSLRPHAKGGLGEVFVARDTELDREVALKEIQLHHAHDTNSRSRFLMEAEITGKLEHPGIVPVYGLGSYSDGRPFYAMRFIRGDSLHVAIQQFHKSLKANELGSGNPYESVAFRKLLGRFVDTCNAVGYAHSRGVLHRDLKPGNVMLGKHGETLVVDWGLAKLKGREESSTAEEATLQISASGSGTDQTLPGSAIGTPGYMSPEQAEGRLDRLGPATDIYGLGATLYSLLTGKRPIEAKTVHEMLWRTVKGEISKPREIHPQIPKPLEAICMKAMALSQHDRYPTCESLAEDVERCLAAEPVTAYREPWADRVRRWFRKHRTLATSTAAMVGVALIGLVIGLALVTGLNQQLDEQNTKLILANQNEQAQRLLAEQREQEAQAARQLAEEHRRLAKGQEILASLSALIAEEQAEQQAVARKEADRQTEIAKKRLDQANEVASELIFIVDRKLKNIAPASAARRDLLDRAQKLLESLLVEAANDPATLRLRAAQLDARGDVARRYEDLNLALDYYTEVYNISRKLAQDDPSNVQAQHDLSVSLIKLGDLATSQGQLPQAQTLYNESFAIDRKLAQDDPSNVQAQRHLAVSLNNLGDLAKTQGQLSQAQTLYNESLALLRKLALDDPSNAQAQRDLSVSLERLGDLATSQGQLPQAQTLYNESLALRRKLALDDPSNAQVQRDLSFSLERLGDLATSQGQLPQAQTLHNECNTLRRKLALDDPSNAEAQRDLSLSLNNLGDLAKTQGQLPQAQTLYNESLAIDRKLALDDPSNAQAQRHLAVSLNNLGDLAKTQGQLPQARILYNECNTIQRNLAQDDPSNAVAQSDLSISLARLGDLATTQGQHPQARTLYNESLALRRKLALDDPSNAEAQRASMVSCYKLGVLAQQAKDWKAAARWFTEAIAVLDRMIARGQNAAQSKREREILAGLLKAVQEAQQPAAQNPAPAIAEKPERASDPMTKSP